MIKPFSLLGEIVYQNKDDNMHKSEAQHIKHQTNEH